MSCTDLLAHCFCKKCISICSCRSIVSSVSAPIKKRNTSDWKLISNQTKTSFNLTLVSLSVTGVSGKLIFESKMSG